MSVALVGASIDYTNGIIMILLALALAAIAALIPLLIATAKRHGIGGGLVPIGKKRSNDAGLTESPLPLPPPSSPLTKVTFKEALNGDELMPSVQKFGEEAINYSLVGQGANFIVQSIRVAEQGRNLNIAYRFSDAGYRMLREGNATIAIHKTSQQLLPELQDRAGRIIELARGKQQVFAQLAAVSSLIVSAACLIASHDTLRRLKKIESKLDVLLAGRKNDQLAKLERIYVRGGELLRRLPYGQTSPELERYRDELCELRSNWRRDVEDILSEANNPAFDAWRETGWRKAVPDFVARRVQSGREGRLYEHLLPLMDIIRCLRLSLLIDICIAQWSGSLEYLFAHTLKSEAEMWAGLTSKLDDHTKKFRGADAQEYLQAVEAARDAIRAYVAAISGELLNETTESNSSLELTHG